MSNENNALVPVDLDSFLGNAPQSSSNLTNLPDSDKVTVVGIFVDDSGSMSDNAEDVKKGVNEILDALRGAKSADFHVRIHGFVDEYFNGLLRDLKEPFGAKYYPHHGISPVVDTAMTNFKAIQKIADDYAAMGIPSSKAYLVITDALPNEDLNPPTAFKELIGEDPSNLVVGMGICRGGLNSHDYHNLFGLMGITKIMTPGATGKEIRNAMNEFSRSVVSAAIVPY